LWLGGGFKTIAIEKDINNKIQMSFNHPCSRRMALHMYVKENHLISLNVVNIR
jgi:hypothetical protein